MALEIEFGNDGGGGGALRRTTYTARETFRALAGGYSRGSERYCKSVALRAENAPRTRAKLAKCARAHASDFSFDVL